MANVDLLIKALNTAMWELSEAFKGLPDEDVWKRPDPRLLSVGELAAHIGYWEAQSFLGDGFESPFSQQAATYYTANVGAPFSLPLSGAQVFAEVTRLHEAAMASWQASPHDSEEQNPHRKGWTWGMTAEYQAFHVAYHTGQIYSVRHLLGHQPVDN